MAFSSPHEIGPRNRLLESLSPGAYQQLAPHLEDSALPRGAILVQPDQPLTRVYFPKSGLVSVIAVYSDGNTIEMAAVGREGCLGVQALLGAQTATARYIVQVPGTISRISVPRLREIMEESPEVRELAECYIVGFLNQVMVSGACNGAHSLNERLARWLLTMHDREKTNEVVLTQEFLAEMLCVHRPTLTMALRLFQTAGLVKLRRGGVSITDRAGLEEATCECYWLIRKGHEKLAPY
jgi:CRP-like cAMP-binding protein